MNPTTQVPFLDGESSIEQTDFVNDSSVTSDSDDYNYDKKRKSPFVLTIGNMI